MDIALIGAAGSGKTDLANELSAYFIEKYNSSTELIDGYTKEVSEASGLALGEYAGYIGNLLVLAARLQLETGVTKKRTTDHSIVCGTVVETITYASINSAMIAINNQPRQAKNGTFLQLCGMIVSDMFVYDHIFYLPYTGEESSSQTFNHELQTALSIFGLPYAKLEGDIESKLEGATKIIEAEFTPPVE